MTLDRRGFLRGTALAGGLAAAGCSSTVASGFTGAQEPRHSLTFWNLFGGGDGVRMQQMERHYQRTHPDISLHAVTLTWGNPYYTKLALATLGKQPPQVAVSHLSRMPRLAAAKLLQPLRAADLARHGLTADRFDKGAWRAAYHGGALYAVPLDTHPFVLYYRTDTGPVRRQPGAAGGREVRRAGQLPGGAAQRRLLVVVWHTVYFTILTTIPLVVLAFVFAVLAERVARGRWFFRLAFFAPYVLPVAVVTIIWGWLYADGIGLLAHWLGDVGVTAPSWLGDPHWVMPSVALTTVWWTLGFNFVLYLAGLQDIPRDVYEAAALDGATPWQQITRITVPMLGRTTTLVTVLQVIASLKLFDQAYLLTGATGGPNQSGRSAVGYVFDSGFVDDRIGYASTTAFLLFLVVLLVSMGWFRLVRRAERGV
jgi:multiple sugar transport system permease protein